jgi:hypothetical protein
MPGRFGKALLLCIEFGKNHMSLIKPGISLNGQPEIGFSAGIVKKIIAL